jgi:hypothetical protein
MNIEAQARRRRTIDQTAFDPNVVIHALKQENKKLDASAKSWKDAWYVAREAFGTYMLWRWKDSK